MLLIHKYIHNMKCRPSPVWQTRGPSTPVNTPAWHQWSICMSITASGPYFTSSQEASILFVMSQDDISQSNLLSLPFPLPQCCSSSWCWVWCGVPLLERIVVPPVMLHVAAWTVRLIWDICVWFYPVSIHTYDCTVHVCLRDMFLKCTVCVMSLMCISSILTHSPLPTLLFFPPSSPVIHSFRLHSIYVPPSLHPPPPLPFSLPGCGQGALGQ